MPIRTRDYRQWALRVSSLKRMATTWENFHKHETRRRGPRGHWPGSKDFKDALDGIYAYQYVRAVDIEIFGTVNQVRRTLRHYGVKQWPALFAQIDAIGVTEDELCIGRKFIGLVKSEAPPSYEQAEADGLLYNLQPGRPPETHELPARSTSTRIPGWNEAEHQARVALDPEQRGNRFQRRSSTTSHHRHREASGLRATFENSSPPNIPVPPIQLPRRHSHAPCPQQPQVQELDSRPIEGLARPDRSERIPSPPPNPTPVSVNRLPSILKIVDRASNRLRNSLIPASARQDGRDSADSRHSLMNEADTFRRVDSGLGRMGTGGSGSSGRHRYRRSSNVGTPDGY